MQGNPKTVGELRQLIAHLSDNVVIVQQTRDGEYYHLPEDAIKPLTLDQSWLDNEGIDEEDVDLEGQDLAFGQTALVIWLDQ